MVRILYCRAYPVRELKRFPFDPERPPSFPDPDGVFFLHEDLCLRAGPVLEDAVVYDGATDAWRTFCRDQLAFKVPEDCR